MLFKRKNPVQGSLSRQAWIRFTNNRAALAGLVWIGLSTIVAILGYLITPDSTPFSNHQQLEIAKSKPGFTTNMLHIQTNVVREKTSLWRKILWGSPAPHNTIAIESWHFRDSLLVYETYSGSPGYPGNTGEIPVWDVVYAIPRDFVPVAVSSDSLHITDLGGTLHISSLTDLQQEVIDKNILRKRFLLGTDRFGRDMLSQLIIGMRVSLSVGFIAVLISLLIGISLGSVAGYFRGHTDNVIVWLINVVWSIPTLLLVIAITFAIGKGFWQVFLAVGLTMWVEVARVVRGQVLSMREKEFVEAARALGLSNLRIIRKHILPNIMGPVIVISAANFASAILIEAGLSFLGIGVQPPMPSWGTMIRDHYGFIILDKGFLAFYPGLLIMLMVLAFMLVGNGLKEALDRTV
jgi:peptide/nickel transport system permease protein